MYLRTNGQGGIQAHTIIRAFISLILKRYPVVTTRCFKCFLPIAVVCLVLAVTAMPAGAVQIAAGADHTVAIRSDGTLWAWGDDTYGELGNGTNAAEFVPTQIGTATWSAVAAGTAFTIALRSDGTLWAWGLNSSAQLGDGTTVNKNAPEQIGTVTNWSAVAAGAKHVLALRWDNNLWTWGDNTFGQLGNGTTTNNLVPTQIGAGAVWTLISAGFDHSAALRSDESLWMWGNNTFGQLGDGTVSSESLPEQIGPGVDWRAPAAGTSFTVALRTDGTLWAWGDNASGQLGIGSLQNRPSPVELAHTGFNEPPVVVSTTPSNGSPNVSLSATIQATFSQPMDGTTITASAVEVSGGTTGQVFRNFASEKSLYVIVSQAPHPLTPPSEEGWSSVGHVGGRFLDADMSTGSEDQNEKAYY